MKPEYKFDSDIWTNEFSLRFYIKYMMRNDKPMYRRFKKYLQIEQDWYMQPTSMKYEYLLPAYFDFINRI